MELLELLEKHLSEGKKVLLIKSDASAHLQDDIPLTNTEFMTLEIAVARNMHALHQVIALFPADVIVIDCEDTFHHPSAMKGNPVGAATRVKQKINGFAHDYDTPLEIGTVT